MTERPHPRTVSLVEATVSALDPETSSQVEPVDGREIPTSHRSSVSTITVVPIPVCPEFQVPASSEIRVPVDPEMHEEQDQSSASDPDTLSA